MKVLIVEDDISSRLLLKKVIEKSGHEVLIAENGKIAYSLIKEKNVDAVLTDWMMPEMDGIELINKIRAEIKPSPVIIVITALASREAMNKAITVGADDFIAKPFDHLDVIRRLENSVNLLKSDQTFNFDSENKKTVKPEFWGIGIAASTGGPQTLINLFSNIKPNNKAAIFIVLHGPAWMLKTFPSKIMEVIKMPVILANDKLKIEPGNIYLAPGDYHTVIDSSNLTLKLLDSAPENFVKPSADPLFRSIAKVFGEKSLAAVLTGMGHDGCIGAGYMKAAGAKIIAQDPETAVLPSMPRAIINLKIATDVLKIEKIGEKISEILNN